MESHRKKEKVVFAHKIVSQRRSIVSLIISFIITMSVLPMTGCKQTTSFDRADVVALTATPTIFNTVYTTPEQTAQIMEHAASQTPVSTAISMTIEEQMKQLPSSFGFTDLSEHQCVADDFFYMCYVVNDEEKYTFFSLGAYEDSPNDMFAVDVFSEYRICSAPLETMLSVVLNGSSPDTVDFAFYPVAYQGQNVAVLECGNLSNFLDSLSAKDGRDLKLAAENSGYRSGVSSVTLEQLAYLYLYALSDSEKVFSKDLMPPA